MGAIVKVDKRHYRKIAQQNWGLTKQQMVGMHVHHRIPVSEGGTDDPTNLYVCSGWFHAYVWHDESYFTAKAAEGGRKGGSAGTEKQKKASKAAGKRVGALPNSPKQIKGVKQRSQENLKNGVFERNRKISHERCSKPVLVTLIETGDTFEFKSLADAARGLNLNRLEIRRVCQGKRKIRPKDTQRPT